VTLTEYGAGTSFPVRLYTVHDGGHTVPAPGVRMSRIMGGSTTNLDAPETAWKLFSALHDSAP